MSVRSSKPGAGQTLNKMERILAIRHAGTMASMVYKYFHL